MTSKKILPRTIGMGAIIGLLAITTACSKPTDPTPRPEVSAADSSGTNKSGTSTSGTGIPIQGASKLGDLTPFHAIASDVASLVDKGELPAAKARIKDLEVQWDSAEAGLKPRASADWRMLDKSIDRALDALRARSPSKEECQAALTDLLRTFDSLEGKR